MKNNYGIGRDSIPTSILMQNMYMEKSNRSSKQIAIDGNSSKGNRKSKFLSFVFAFVALCVCSLFVGEAWGQTVYVYTNTITTGNRYLIVSSNETGSKYALGYTLSGNNASVSRDAVTVNAGTTATGNAVYINSADVDSKSVWTAGGNYTFKNGNYYVSQNNNSPAISQTLQTWSHGYNTLYYSSGNNTYYLRYNNGWSFKKNDSRSCYLFEERVLTSYHVTYDGNGNTGGSVPTDGTNYSSGNTVTVKDNTGNLVKTGYEFAGWNTAANGSGTSYAPGATFRIYANTTLYAQWTRVYSYNITYNANGGTPTTASQSGTGSSVTISNNGFTAPAGKVFAGWNTAANGSGTSYTEGQVITLSADLNLTLYAQWIRQTCTTEDFSGYTAADYDASTYQQPTGWYCSTTGSYPPRITNNDVLYYEISGMSGRGNFLYMIYNSYCVMPLATLSSLSFNYAFESSSYGTLKIGYVTNPDNASGTWTELRTPLTATTELTTITLTSAEISEINAANGYVAFSWTAGIYGVGIDDIVVCTESCEEPTGTFAYSPTFNTLAVNATLNCALSTNGLTPNAGDITYESSNPSVASVNNAGLVTGVSEGVAVITATFTPSDDNYCSISTSRTIVIGCSYSAPLCFDFEEYTATANTAYYLDAGMPQCWSRIYTGTYANGGPHLYKGTEAKDGVGIVMTSGNYSEYSENFGFANYVVMPYITGLSADDMISFNAWWQYQDFGELSLGYITNLGDPSTFTLIANVEPYYYLFGSPTAGLNEITLPTIPTGAFLAFKWVYENNYYSYSVVIDNVCICHPISGTFAFSPSSSTFASMSTYTPTLTNSGLGVPGTVTYSSSNNNVAVVNSEGVITGVAEGVATICATFTPDNSDYCPRIAEFTATITDGCTKIGNGGSNTTHVVPVNNYYNYTYTQILYEKSRLTAGLITSIGFEYAYSTSMTAKNSVVIYMMEVNKTTFSSETNWVTPLGDASLVYSGTLNCETGWNSFSLDNPFNYSGTKDLLLIIDDNSGSYNNSSYTFKYTSASNTVLYYNSDSDNYGNTTISGVTGNLSSYRPNTKFCIFTGSRHNINYITSTNCTDGFATSIESSYGVEGYTVLVTNDIPTCSTGTFLRWDTRADGHGTSYSSGSPITIGSSDINLYAIYQICNYVDISKVGSTQGDDDGVRDDENIQRFNVCLGSDLSLIANKKSGVDDAITINYRWEVNKHNGDAPLRVNEQTLTYTADNAMGHDILLISEASDGCREEIPVRVRVSHGLTAEDGASAGDICVGSGKEIFVGDPSVVPESIIEVDNENIVIKSTKGKAVTKFIPDGVGECFTSDVTFADFKESTIITDASNIDYVRVNLEHAFIADIQISLKCWTPDNQERSVILLQDYKSTESGSDVYSANARDAATYDWPYRYICCYAKYKRYYNNGYNASTGCTGCGKGASTGNGTYNMLTYLKYDGSNYSATGYRIDATGFDVNTITQDQMLDHLQNMINSVTSVPGFCIGQYYYEFDSWSYGASHYTSDNYSYSDPSEPGGWAGLGKLSSIGFGKPNPVDDASNYSDKDFNPYGEGLDYCWSNSTDYSYGDGNGTVVESVNHQVGYTNGMVVKPSNVEEGTQYYHPYQSFTGLVGCKLNGQWVLQICDSYAEDNGYIFSWEIALKGIDDNAWTYDVTLKDSHLGSCDGFHGDYTTITPSLSASDDLLSEISGTPHFYVHPTLQNIVTENVEIDAVRNCSLTLVDNIGCESSGQGFTYKVVQPTEPTVSSDPICFGEEASISAGLSTGFVGNPTYTWTLNGTTIAGQTSNTYTVTPNNITDIYGVEVYDGAGCGGILDTVIKIKVPSDVASGGDYTYIWHGKSGSTTSTDWNTANNWYVYDGVNFPNAEDSLRRYSIATQAPSITDNVYVGDSRCDANRNPSTSALADAHNLTIGTGASVTVPAGKTLNIAGNLNNIGTLNATNGTVVFCGPSSDHVNQEITHDITLGNVTFNNQGGDIEPSGSVTITGDATFTAGLVKSDVTFNAGSSAAVSSENSFVTGKVTKIVSSGNTEDFTFPTGSAADGQPRVLGSVSVDDLPAGTTQIAFHQKSANNGDDSHGFTLADGYPRWWNVNDMCSGNNPQFDHVSNYEYWSVKSAATSSISATLTVSAESAGAHFNPSTIDHEGGDIYGALWTGSCWKNIGGHAGTVSNPYGVISVDVTIPYPRAGAEEKIVSLGSLTKTTVLPIELTTLAATCDGRSSLVEWTTATERNNDYFIIERSDNAIDFYEVARVAGVGNSIAPLDYSYIDYGVHGGDNYYRLVQVDYDGSRTVSEMVVATCVEAGEEPEVLAYPNPFNGDLTVELENFSNRPARIDVYDVLGKLVYTEDADAPQNNYQTVLHLDGLSNSTYTVRVSTTDFVINRKVVKQ